MTEESKEKARVQKKRTTKSAVKSTAKKVEKKEKQPTTNVEGKTKAEELIAQEMMKNGASIEDEEEIREEKEDTADKEDKKQQDSAGKKKRKTHWKTIVILIILAVLVNQIFFNQGVFSSEPAAYVNGEKISLKELDTQYERLPTQYKAFMDKYTVLERMIDFKVVMQEAQKSGIKVSNKEIDSVIAGIRGPTSHSDFVEQVKYDYSSYKEFENELKETLLVQKYVSSQLPEFEITEDDIALAYEHYLATNPKNMFRASHILVCHEKSERCESTNTKEEALEIANKIAEEVTAENFATYATEYSQGPSSVSGGDLGWFAKGQMATGFEDAVMQLEQGEISEPIETEFGYHIIKLDDERENIVYSQDEIKTYLRFSMFNTLQMTYNDEFVSFVESLKKESEISIEVKEEDYRNVIEVSSQDELDEIINARTEQTLSESTAESTDDNSDVNVDDTETEREEELSNAECFAEFGIEESIIFYGSEASTRSNNVKAMLEVDFLDLNKESDLSAIKACINGFNEVIFPQLICTTNNETLVGEQSKEDIDSFIASC